MNKYTLPDVTNVLNTIILVGMLAVGVRFYDSIVTQKDMTLQFLDLQINQANKEIGRLQVKKTLGGALDRFEQAEIQNLKQEIDELNQDKEAVLREK